MALYNQLTISSGRALAAELSGSFDAETSALGPQNKLILQAVWLTRRRLGLRRCAISIVQSLITRQKELCWSFDRRFVSESFRLDGNARFVGEFVPRYLRPGAVVYDMGGGKQPLIPVAKKKELGLTVVGVDVDPNELARAPAGAYDRIVFADIQSYHGAGDADLVICQAVLEHVRSLRPALKGVFSALKPGVVALAFVPCRNSCYARLNLILPQHLKRRILFYVAPETKHDQGFPAYYDCCTPRQFRALAGECGVSVVEEQAYYRSSYFSFLLPLYVLWRLWVGFFHFIAGEQASESFSIAFRKNSPAADGSECGPATKSQLPRMRFWGVSNP